MNELITRLFAVRAQISEIKKTALKPLETEQDELEQAILEHLEEQGVDSAKIKGIGSVTISEQIVPSVENWDSFYEYIHANKAFFLLNRAPNAAAFRETLEHGEEIAGVVPFTKRKLSVRAA